MTRGLYAMVRRGAGLVVMFVFPAICEGSVTDSVLRAYWLDPVIEVQLDWHSTSPAPIWQLWSGKDSIHLTAPRYCYPGRCFFDDTADAWVTVKAAAGDSGLYLLTVVGDDAWEKDIAAGTGSRRDGLSIYIDALSSTQIDGCTDCLVGLYRSGLTYSTYFLSVLFGDTADMSRYYAGYEADCCISYQTLVSTWTDSTFKGLGIRGTYGTLDQHTRWVQWRIPWTLFGSGCIPRGQRRFAFTVGYDDFDSPTDSVSMLRWVGKDPWAMGANDTLYWGDIELDSSSGGLPQRIALLYPNGGETWVAGQLADVRWRASCDIAAVKTDYSTDNGHTWQTLRATWPNSGLIVWEIPNIPSDQWLVRVCDTTEGMVCDTSDAFFSVVPASSVLPRPSAKPRIGVAGMQSAPLHDLRGRAILTAAGTTRLRGVYIDRLGKKELFTW